MATETQQHRTQIAFRFDDSLIARIKMTAREKHLSLNDFALQVFERATRLSFPTLPKDFTISDEIRSLACLHADPRYLSTDPQEQIRLDKQAKLEYLLSKYGER